ncbi:MAG: T9SS type A sorting domain-containing protein, partial [Candidatus Marinimicrobia bacterium]|nr:T9SS type A sorting domain-containing protein [Candidatus Neomarinimicrobiota bacterium]
ILLMHFENNLTNSSDLSDDGVAHGSGVSYSSYANSSLGQCIKLDNSNTSYQSYVSIPHNDNLNLTGSWTIEAWFYLNSIGADAAINPTIVSKASSFNNHNYFVWYHNSWGSIKGQFTNSDNVDIYVGIGNNTITTGKWYHIAYIRDDTQNVHRLLIHSENREIIAQNEIQYDESQSTPILNVEDVLIGKLFSPYSFYADGYIDEVRISNIVRDFKAPPVVSDIPDQTINEGSSFATINLDDFVNDPDNEASEISWVFSGNDELSVEIGGNRVATVSTPDENWFGSEIITFTATDPGNASSSNDVMFTVNPVNDPPVISGAPELVEFVSDTIVTIDIWALVSDVETSVDLLLYDFNVDSDSILFSYDDGAGILTLSAELEFGGESDLIWSVSDSIEIVEDIIHIVVEKAAIVGIDESVIPEEFALYQNYPNPFNPTTSIKYSLPKNTNVTLTVYNTAGQVVEVLVNKNQSSGNYTVKWDARYIPSGVYFYQLQADDFQQVKKCLLIK